MLPSGRSQQCTSLPAITAGLPPSRSQTLFMQVPGQVEQNELVPSPRSEAMVKLVSYDASDEWLSIMVVSESRVLFPLLRSPDCCFRRRCRKKVQNGYLNMDRRNPLPSRG